MRELTLDEIKKIENDILRYIFKICEENNIRFYLAYGTALGAVRHQGFIPWDDDIDIHMTRENYRRFAEVMQNQESNYRLLSVDTDEQYYMSLPKVVDTRTIWYQHASRTDLMPLGVYVDVFVLDNVPMDEVERKKLFQRLDRYQRLWVYVQRKKTYSGWGLRAIFKRLIYFFAKRVNPRYFAVKLDRLSQKYSDQETTLVGNLAFPQEGCANETMPKTFFGDGVKHVFEEDDYLLPNNWDGYLHQYYGDYMTPPPENERVTRHLHTAYLKTEAE